MDLKIDQLFYTADFKGTLNESESKHCVQVLRKKKGDKIHVTNGTGDVFFCEIINHAKVCELRILENITAFEPPIRNVSVAIAPTKNADRIEYFLEKAVEIGLQNVFFIKTQNTVASRINIERMEKIVISAMKQSIKSNKTAVFGMTNMKDFLARDFTETQKLVAHYTPEAVSLHHFPIQSKTLILIGPEGDFDTAELTDLASKGFQTVTLGTSRLRTETAGILATGLLNLL